MRKRNIKTVAHWVIMCFLLLFPIVLVGISAFANDEQNVTVTETYEYQTNEVDTVDDLVEGNIYKLNLNNDIWLILDDTIFFECTDIYTFDGYFTTFNNVNIGTQLLNVDLLLCTENNNDLFTNASFDDYIYFDYGTYYFVYHGTDDYYINNVQFLINNNFISSSDYLGIVTTDVEITETNYKQEVNNWANGFKRLPVNQWYGQLLDVIGVGQTTNSVMNVIYVYPLYVLWVYLIDLILDCLLVIVNIGHNALKRLDGDVE